DDRDAGAVQRERGRARRHPDPLAGHDRPARGLGSGRDPVPRAMDEERQADLPSPATGGELRAAMTDVCVIVNPASGKGRGAKAAERVRQAFAAVGVTDIRSTKAKGDEKTVALRAIQDGARTIVAVGGDGTWSNVANAILSSGAPVRLAFAAAGTGNDFAKTVGAPASDFAATARLAVDGPDVAV